MKIVLATGGFDPIHSGHISYLKKAKRLGDKLIVGLNSDDWLTRKKGKPFMTFKERKSVISELKCVDKVIGFNDNDNTSMDAIFKVYDAYPKAEIVFVNGGDRKEDNIPETQIIDDRITFEFKVGGNTKRNSSSWILNDWSKTRTERIWGYYRVLHTDGATTKVKELTVYPGQRLSYQMHKDRAEYWHIAHGSATVTLEGETFELHKHDKLHVPAGLWHRIANNSDDELRIVEIQYGKRCDEDDIIRQ